MTRRAPWPTALIVVVTLAASVGLAACATATRDASMSSPAPTATSRTGSLGAGFYDPDAPPAPEGTVDPRPGSWDDAHPPAGYTVTLLSYGDDPQTAVLRRAVTTWAADEGVTVRTVAAKSPDTLLAAVALAIDERSDLVISVGHDLVDPIAAISPGALHQQFLVLGAEIAEPTSNVTAADWTGGGFRGEGLGTPTHYDPDSFTPERAGRALRAGVAALLNELNGTVVWVD